MRGVVAATAISLLALTTALMFTNDGLALSVERQLPTELVVLELFAGVLLVASGWVSARGRRPHVSVALGVTALGILLPLWAAWPSLPGWARAAVLGVAPLSVPGAAQVALGWNRDRGHAEAVRLTYLLAAAASLTHLLAYNPFADPACLRTCVDIRPVASVLLDTRSALVITALLTIAAALVAALAARRARRSLAPGVIIAGVAAALVALGTAWAIRVAGSGDPRQSELVLVLPAVAGGVVSMAVLGAATPDLADTALDRTISRPTSWRRRRPEEFGRHGP